MVDITMCSNEGCKAKEYCYRQRATPDENWQSYSLFQPKNNVQGEDFECAHWIEYLKGIKQ